MKLTKIQKYFEERNLTIVSGESGFDENSGYKFTIQCPTCESGTLLMSYRLLQRKKDDLYGVICDSCCMDSFYSGMVQDCAEVGATLDMTKEELPSTKTNQKIRVICRCGSHITPKYSSIKERVKDGEKISCKKCRGWGNEDYNEWKKTIESRGYTLLLEPHEFTGQRTAELRMLCSCGEENPMRYSDFLFRFVEKNGGVEIAKCEKCRKRKDPMFEIHNCTYLDSFHRNGMFYYKYQCGECETITTRHYGDIRRYGYCKYCDSANRVKESNLRDQLLTYCEKFDITPFKLDKITGVTDKLEYRCDFCGSLSDSIVSTFIQESKKACESGTHKHCRKCPKDKLIIQRIKDRCLELEFEYIDCHKWNGHYIVECHCKCGEYCTPLSNNLFREGKTGCMVCTSTNQRHSIESVKETLLTRGFTYIDGEYTSNKDVLRVKCPKGHVRRMSYHNIVNGRNGCAVCCQHGFSMRCIEWLKGFDEFEYIQHAMCEEGEFEIEGVGKVDGYCEDTNTVYEFHGDYWHGNPEIFDPDDVNSVNGKTFGELYRLTKERESLIWDAGYDLVVIWEKDWLESLK